MLSRGIGTMGGVSPFVRSGGMGLGMMSMMGGKELVPGSPAVVRKGAILDESAGTTPLRPKRRKAPTAPPAGSTLPRRKHAPLTDDADADDSGEDDDEGTVLDRHAPVPWHSTFRGDAKVNNKYYYIC